MIKSDKKENIKKANLLAESRHLNRVTEITPNWVETDKWHKLEDEVKKAIIPSVE